MYFYDWNIGDWRRSTRTMTPLEKGWYREMIDELRDTEKPLPLDETELFEQMGATSEKDKGVIRKVLKKKWIEYDGGLIQKRSWADILNYKEIRHKKAEAGREGGRTKQRRLLEQKLAGAKQVLDDAKQGLAPLVSHKPEANNQKPIDNTPALPGLAGAEVSLSVPEWAVLIRAAYGRTDSPDECERRIVAELQRGVVKPAEMLEKVQACTAAITKHAPGGTEDPFAPLALTFFTGQRWTDPRVFELRWSDRAKKEGAPGLGDGMSDGITDIPEPEGWREAWPELYDFPAPSTWRDVPEAGQRDLLQWLPTREKRKGAA